MMLLLFCHLIIAAICLILKITNTDDAVVGLCFVILSCITTIAYVMRLNGVSRDIKLVILAGIAIRVICVAIDVFVTRLPDAGTDDDGFYNTSVLIYDSGYSNISEITRGGLFPKFLSLVYFVIGSSRFSAQYLNVLFFVISAVLFVKSLSNYGISKKYSKIGTIIFCLMPNAVLFNSILRRETIMEVFVCASLYNLSRWYVSKRSLYAFYSTVFIAMASLFHTAFIFAAPIFVVYFALYDREKNSVSFSVNKISKMIILLICAIVVGVGFLSLWKNKLTAVSDMDDIYFTANRASGGSVYLENYKVESLGQLVLFTPLKLFYFLFSPVPWKFRNAMDIISFVLDAFVYIYLIATIIRKPKNSVPKLLFVTFIIMAAIFAIGTFNSGTAIRHRFSLLPILLVSYVMTQTETAERKAKLERLEGKNALSVAVGGGK